MNEKRTPKGQPVDEQPDLWLVDQLIAGIQLPSNTPERERVRMQRIVDALRAPAAPHELAAQETYLAMFDHESATTRNTPVRTIVLGTRAAVVAGVAVLAAATGAAAYTGSLPGSLQSAARSTIGAPAADDDPGSDDPSDDPSGTPSTGPRDTATETATSSSGSSGKADGVGPDATGPAAFGLCNAWSHGGLATTSVAYRNLAAAAGGTGGIQAYCATVVKPGGGSTHGSGSPASKPGHGSPTSHHGHGSPTTHPGKSVHPKGSPATHSGGH
jgi:hypothetical protein